MSHSRPLPETQYVLIVCSKQLFYSHPTFPLHLIPLTLIRYSTGCTKLHVDFGIGGTALKWLHSFTTGRSQYVGVGSVQSAAVVCLSGVLQEVYWGYYSSPFTYRQLET